MQIDPTFGRQPAEKNDLGGSDTASLPSVEPSPVDLSGPTAGWSGGRAVHSESGSQESWSLETLEADIAAVGSAMETVDRIVAGVTSGEGSVGSAAAEIAAVVSRERFGTPGSATS